MDNEKARIGIDLFDYYSIYTSKSEVDLEKTTLVDPDYISMSLKYEKLSDIDDWLVLPPSQPSLHSSQPSGIFVAPPQPGISEEESEYQIFVSCYFELQKKYDGQLANLHKDALADIKSRILALKPIPPNASSLGDLVNEIFVLQGEKYPREHEVFLWLESMNKYIQKGLASRRLDNHLIANLFEVYDATIGGLHTARFSTVSTRQENLCKAWKTLKILAWIDLEVPGTKALKFSFSVEEIATKLNMKTAQMKKWGLYKWLEKNRDETDEEREEKRYEPDSDEDVKIKKKKLKLV